MEVDMAPGKTMTIVLYSKVLVHLPVSESKGIQHYSLRYTPNGSAVNSLTTK